MPSQKVKQVLPTAVAPDSKSDIMGIASALPVSESNRQTAQIVAANTSATDVQDVTRLAGTIFGSGIQAPVTKYTQQAASGQ
jgi:hypothetical protein